ncbi:MAG: caspase family protein [Candidatus Eisenbacteria bacterium]|uniref:Caspase family protein n=1 Tax=Eiseniibacteriota bacterium TaxID=2212470 RepID=A0A948W356_UNCEI|nr:caspase family protein [Candidatus Eisenbacteria bacterium]
MARILNGPGAVAFAMLILSATAFAQPAGEPAPVRRAILIGINEYMTDEFMDLRGAVNDVETMREILTSRFGFLEENVTVLTDAAATRAAILETFEKLIEQTAPQDFVYIHYSGHGSQVPDLNRDEPDDNWDETIVPHDARTPGIADITDDELGGILARLPAQKAVIILDSCHSGTATRGIFVNRSVPPDPRTELYKRPQNEIATRNIVPLDKPERYVLLTGAASNQNALDGPLEGKFRGFFTYALARTLAEAGPGVSPRDLHEGVQRVFDQLSARFGGLPFPEPQVEASPVLLEEPLFPIEGGKPCSKPFLVVERESGGRVRLIRGATLNASVNTYWAIYPPEETEFHPGEGIATARVVATDGMDVMAEVEPSDAGVRFGSRAVILSDAPPPTRVTARWEVADPERRAGIEAEVHKRFPDVDFVAAGDFAWFLLEAQEGICRVYDAAGLSIVDEFHMKSDETVGERLAGLFSRSLMASSLVAMTNPSSDVHIDARVVGMESNNTLHIRKPGAPRCHENSLMLAIRVSTDSYLTIVDVDAQGGVNLLFPNPHSKAGFYPQGFVRGAATVRIPDSLEEGNEAGFFWDYQAPAGGDAIQVFASTDRETAETIRRWINGILETGARGGRSASASPAQVALQRLQNELMRRVVTRGVGVVADASDAVETAENDLQEQKPAPDWNAVTVRLQVQE